MSGWAWGLVGGIAGMLVGAIAVLIWIGRGFRNF